jgi:anaerobic selenocysteine-containing dehydrogenase
MRPPVVRPQNESWPDLEILFELAKRLGMGEKFWNGDIEAAFNHMFAPSGVTLETLQANPGGISVDLRMTYRKYAQKDPDGGTIGFPTPSKRVEIYSEVFQKFGYEPLPNWTGPPGVPDRKKDYPLTLIGGKILEYCHSQHRAVPSLRKGAPYPYLEINPAKAEELAVREGDWVKLETAHGNITLRAKLTDVVPYDVVCTQNGWWQGCRELDLPGYDPFSPHGANENMLHGCDDMDPISGCLPLKGCPCDAHLHAVSS